MFVCNCVFSRLVTLRNIAVKWPQEKHLFVFNLPKLSQKLP